MALMKAITQANLTGDFLRGVRVVASDHFDFDSALAARSHGHAQEWYGDYGEMPGGRSSKVWVR